MFFPRKECAIPTCDQHNDSQKMKLEVPSNASQGGDTIPHFSIEHHTEETNFDNHDIQSSEEQQTSDNYSITHDRQRRAIKKPTCIFC